MAKILHDPNYSGLLGRKYSLTFEPCIFQFAGEENIPQSVINELVDGSPLNWESNLKKFKSQLKHGQEVWVVPPGKVTDFSSQPDWVDLIIPREAIRLPALIHDDTRVKWTFGNAPTDGFFRGCIVTVAEQYEIEKVGPKKAYLAYAGVRFGTWTGFKSAPQPAVIEEARKRWANFCDVSVDRVYFSDRYSELKIKAMP